MDTSKPEASAEAPETAPDFQSEPAAGDALAHVGRPEFQPPVDLAPADEEGRLAFVLDWGGQLAWLHEAEAPAADVGRRATLRDLAIAGVAIPAASPADDA
jgi:hypothetical protein